MDAAIGQTTAQRRFEIGLTTLFAPLAAQSSQAYRPVARARMQASTSRVRLSRVRIGRLAVWTLTGTLALLPHDPTAQPATIEERGVAFPVTLTPPGGGPPHRLTGTATRERTIFKVDVYAYGLYLEPEAARAQLAAFAGRPAAAIDRDRSFYARLLELRIPMLLRLVTTRDLTGGQLGDAFDEALKPRVARAAAERKMPGGDAALARFRGYFNLGQLAHGTTIVFACGEARLTASVNAELRPPLVSPALCWALFDTYLGERAIAADGRRRLVAGVPALLARVPLPERAQRGAASGDAAGGVHSRSR